MKTLTVSEVARNIRAIIDGVETDRKEILITRNGKPIAQLVPEPPALNGLEVLGDLFPKRLKKHKLPNVGNK